MSTIRKLISACMAMLLGSLLLPLLSVAAISGTTYDAPSTTTTPPVTIAEHTTAVGEAIHSNKASLQSMAEGQIRSLSGLSHLLKAPKNTATYTQMEFPFAKGASVQTPGVTTAGERFVRVGAKPQNLKFSFDAAGGVQKGTYVFPESTFNAIGRNPAALKNFGDLPGAAPQYYRIISPPTGTPIQRGIVPGGEFGGVGGVEEAILGGF